MKKIVVVLGVLLFISTPLISEPLPAPRSLLLFIGDGFGVSHLALGALGAEALNRTYFLSKFSRVGLMRVRSLTGYVTDSAAAGTAIATGHKTYNGAIGVDNDKKNVSNISELLIQRGWNVGIVTTTRITHATPAVFYAHDENRGSEKRIARELLNSRISIALGGGANFFPPVYLRLIVKNGISVVKSKRGLENLNPSTSRVLGLFSKSHLPYTIDRDKNVPTLKEMTNVAIKFLRGKDKPFFLMVEGGRIDHAAHVHDAPSVMNEILAFNDAVLEGLEYLKESPRSLVIETADHATGGMDITEVVDVESLLSFSTSADSLSKTFVRIKDDVSALKYMRGVLQEDKIDTDEIHRILTNKNSYRMSMRIGDYISRTMGVSFLPVDYQIRRNIKGHTGEYVPFLIEGDYSDLQRGLLDNTNVFDIINKYAENK